MRGAALGAALGFEFCGEDGNWYLQENLGHEDVLAPELALFDDQFES